MKQTQPPPKQPEKAQLPGANLPGAGAMPQPLTPEKINLLNSAIRAPKGIGKADPTYADQIPSYMQDAKYGEGKVPGGSVPVDYGPTDSEEEQQKKYDEAHKEAWWDTYEEAQAAGYSHELSKEMADNLIKGFTMDDAAPWLNLDYKKTMGAGEAEQHWQDPSKMSPTAETSMEELQETFSALDNQMSMEQAQLSEELERRLAAGGKGGTGYSAAQVAAVMNEKSVEYAKLKSDAMRDMLTRNQAARDAALERDFQYALRIGDRDAQERAADKLLSSQKETEIRQMIFDAPDQIVERYGGDEWASGHIEKLNKALAEVNKAHPDDQMGALLEVQSNIAVNSKGKVFYTGEMMSVEEWVNSFDSYYELTKQLKGLEQAATNQGLNLYDFLLEMGVDPGDLQLHGGTSKTGSGAGATTHDVDDWAYLAGNVWKGEKNNPYVPPKTYEG
tara:strand:+ start:11595 stop:12932 length:1338 start_codon:yes stop_codon:yes gene_type:complete